MVRWGLVADLNRCVGCQTCTMACKLDNNTPPGVMWRNVRDVEMGEYPAVRRFFLPMQCMHCADPPCMKVCPTTATIKRKDGIVYVDIDKCIGCGYCVLACAYEARWLVKSTKSYFEGNGAKESWNGKVLNIVGVCTKCDFCMDRIDFGTKNGSKVGMDPEATPVCVNSCPARALIFGDLDDPSSEVAKILKERKSFTLHPEIGTNPSVYYLW